jgi:hypothetical protein
MNHCRKSPPLWPVIEQITSRIVFLSCFISSCSLCLVYTVPPMARHSVEFSAVSDILLVWDKRNWTECKMFINTKMIIYKNHIIVLTIKKNWKSQSFSTDPWLWNLRQGQRRYSGPYHSQVFCHSHHLCFNIITSTLQTDFGEWPNTRGGKGALTSGCQIWKTSPIHQLKRLDTGHNKHLPLGGRGFGAMCVSLKAKNRQKNSGDVI